MVNTVHGPKLPEDKAREHFTWGELECKCGCGAAWITDESLDKLEALRVRLDKPLTINSAVRCPNHNAAVGGAFLSYHVSTDFKPSCAFDISLKTVDKVVLIECAELEDFRGIGISYNSFVHVDDRNVIARW